MDGITKPSHTHTQILCKSKEEENIAWAHLCTGPGNLFKCCSQQWLSWDCKLFQTQFPVPGLCCCNPWNLRISFKRRQFFLSSSRHPGGNTGRIVLLLIGVSDTNKANNVFCHFSGEKKFFPLRAYLFVFFFNYLVIFFRSNFKSQIVLKYNQQYIQQVFMYFFFFTFLIRII